LIRPIIARLRSESHLNDRITSRGTHQSLSQQNLPTTDSRIAANSMLFDHLVGAGKVVLGEVVKLRWRGPTPPLRVTLG
jgi:hypothetical protein